MGVGEGVWLLRTIIDSVGIPSNMENGVWERCSRKRGCCVVWLLK